MPRDDRYGLAFVQNHTVLGSLRIVAVGCLFVFFIPALAPVTADRSFLLGHFVVSNVVAIALGVYDGPKRLALFQARLDCYDFEGAARYKMVEKKFPPPEIISKCAR